MHPKPVPERYTETRNVAAVSDAGSSMIRKPRFSQSTRAVIHDITDIDFRRISLPMAIRTTIGIGVPLLIAAMLNHPDLAVMTGVGAFSVGFSDRVGRDIYKFPRMFLTTIMAATSVCVGLLLHEYPIAAAAYAVVLSGFTGLLTMFGPGPTQSGATTVVAFLIASQFVRPASEAFWLAGVVIIVGLFQSLLASTVDRTIMHDSRSETISDAYHALARYIANPDDHVGDAPGAAQITAATQLVESFDASPGGAESRQMVNTIQVMQEEVLAIGLFRRRTTTVIDTRTQMSLQRLAASTLRSFATRVIGSPAGDESDELLALATFVEHAAANVAASTDATVDDRYLAYRYEQLVAMLELSRQQIDAYLEQTHRPQGLGSWLAAWKGRFRGNLAVIRTNMTMSSPAVRHAIRQMLVIAICFTISLSFHLSWGNWVALTAIVVLRPDYRQTFSRGTGRLLGTILGLAIGSLVMSMVPEGIVPWAIATISFAFLVRLMFPVGFVLNVASITAYVVALLQIRGLSPIQALQDRSINTVIGGVVAMGVFLLWPTWESPRLSDAIAQVIGRFRGVYTAAVDAILVSSKGIPEQVHSTRNGARMARASASAHVSRIHAEPGVSLASVEAAQEIIYRVQRMAQHTLGFEACLRDMRPHGVAPDVVAFIVGSRRVLDDAQAAVTSLEPPAAPEVDVISLAARACETLGAGPETPAVVVGVERGILALAEDAEAIFSASRLFAQAQASSARA